MAVQVDTSPQSSATERVRGRKVLRTSNGTLWVVAHQATDTVPRLRYSTDDGVNWSTSSTAFPETIESRQASWVFCSDGAIYMLYEIADRSEIRVRKGTLNGAHTDITWSSPVTVIVQNNVENFDLAVHEENGDTYVHVAYGNTGALCEYKRSVWPAAFGSTQVLTTWVGSSAPKIEFNHTQADVTAVKDSTPHVYVSWIEDGKIMFRKNVFSSGPSWAWNAARTITTDVISTGFFGFAMFFDGTSVVMIVESLGTADALLVLERDAADTTTTPLANTPTRNGTNISYNNITYNPDRDIEAFHADSVTKVMQHATYDRSGSSWGSWATVETDRRYPNVKLGYWSGSKGNNVELVYMDATGTPYPIMYERFTFPVEHYIEVVEAADTTDSVLIALEILRAIAEDADTTDTVTLEKELYRTIAEAAGTTDSVAIFKAAVKLLTIAEAAGTTDSVLVVSFSPPYTMDLTSDPHLIRLPTSEGLRTRLDRFRARYDYRYQGLAVLATETAPGVWAITKYPGIEVIDNDAALAASEIFYGGRDWAVAGSLATALAAAGYDVTLD